MPRTPLTLRSTLLSARDLLVTLGPFLLIALALLAGAYYLLKPNPPRKVVLATGPEQSDYAAYGQRYAEQLRRHGIEVVLRHTEGSSENRRLLLDARQDVDLGFVRGDAGDVLRNAQEKEDSVPLVSLGSLAYEPVWIFYRKEAEQKLKGRHLERLDQMRDWRVGSSARGHGATGLLLRLLESNGLEREKVALVRRDLTGLAIGLIEGNLDAAVLVSGPDSPILQMLLRTPGIGLYDFSQADAYSRRFGYLTPVTLPRGVVDLAHDIPPRGVQLLAPATLLLAREDTHPALVQLFVQAAAQIHGGSGWFSRTGQFPARTGAEIPLAPEADRFLKNGPPLLQRYLPFWLANLIDRMWVALVSIIAILIPLSRVVPPLYQFRVRSRIFRWYKLLRQVEDRLAHNASPDSLADLRKELDELDARVERIPVPLAYTDELYALRAHIDLVRARLDKRAA